MGVVKAVEAAFPHRETVRVPHHPHRQRAMEKQEQEKDGSAENVAEADRGFLAVDLDRALPVLQIEPGTDEQADDKRDRVAPEAVRRVVVVGSSRRAGDAFPEIEKIVVDKDGAHADQEQRPQQGVAGLDFPDAELLAEEAAHRQQDEDDHGHGKPEQYGGAHLRRQEKGHEKVFHQREDGQGERDDLVDVEDEPEGLGELVEKQRQRFVAAGVAFCDDLREAAEKHEADRVRNREHQQPLHPEHEGDLDAEKQPQPPHPRQRDGISPQQRVQPAQIHAARLRAFPDFRKLRVTGGARWRDAGKG